MIISSIFNRMKYFAAHDTMRPALNHICFRNDTVIATDGHILISMHLTDEEMPHVNYDVLIDTKVLEKAFYVADKTKKFPFGKTVEVVPVDKGVVRIISKGNGYETTILHMVDNNLRYPHIGSLFSEPEAPVSAVDIDASLLNRFSKLYDGGIKSLLEMHFCGDNKGIMLKFKVGERIIDGIIMPLRHNPA